MKYLNILELRSIIIEISIKIEIKTGWSWKTKAKIKNIKRNRGQKDTIKSNDVKETKIKISIWRILKIKIDS